MSIPTPRTDAALIPNADFSDWGHGDSPYVQADFARQLERELADAPRANESLAGIVTTSGTTINVLKEQLAAANALLREAAAALEWAQMESLPAKTASRVDVAIAAIDAHLGKQEASK